MATPGRAGPQRVPGGWWERRWAYVLDFCLTLWVLRAPVAILAVGLLLMWAVPQAQDLLVELAMPASPWDWLRIGIFFALLLIIWAMPMHYAARLLVRGDAGYLRRIDERDGFIKGLQKWTPRVLGVATIAVMAGGVWRAWLNLPLFTDPAETAAITLHLLVVASGLVALAILFWLYAVYREHVAASAVVMLLEELLDRSLSPLLRWLPPISVNRQLASRLGPVLLFLMFIGFAGLPMAFTLWFAEHLPRALSVPFVLGGWLPLLAYMSGLGRRLRVPLILGGFVLVCVLPLVFGNNYAIRRIDQAVDPKNGHSKDSVVDAIDLKVAIDWWKAANCDDKGCPRPLIFAAAGGASRAGFFTASVVGQLLDDKLLIDGKGHGLTPEKMANRIFALSTVSGSSVGAAMTVAAMAASDKGVQPCGDASAPLWDGDKVTSWRSCLEALASGDFLTPIFTGFVFRDIFGFMKWPDRGTLLEESLEHHFANLIRKPLNPGGLACIGKLDCAFMTLRPTKDHWVPLLLLNSTSVKVGQRVITTPLAWQIDLKDNNNCPNNIRELTCEIFQRGANFYDWQGRHPNPKRELRVSTAAHNSARFPLLSPPGSIADADGHIVDRLVDGGYFENFGAQTATELARAVHALDPSLNPFILVLSNDSELVYNKGAGVPPAEMDSGSTFLPDILDSIGAFAQTRNARGVLAVEGGTVALDHANAGQCNLAWVRVWSQRDPQQKGEANARQLSMSWWLSKPVQRYLRQQTEYAGGEARNGHGNKASMRGLLDAIANAKLPPFKPGDYQCLTDED